MEDTVKERIKAFIKFKGITMKSFENQCNLSTGYVTSMRKGFGRVKLSNVLTAYPELNRDWLLYGEGTMLNDPDIVEEDEDIGRCIPFYDVETTGGFNGHVSDSSEGAIVGYIQPGGWFGGSETAAIRHVGNSMVEYPDGCVLAVKQVNDIRLLVPGRNYVIETREYRVTKRVQRGNRPNTIMLYSTNTDKYEDGRLIHEPFEVELDDVVHIYSVLGYIVNQSGEIRIIKP